MIKLSRLDRQEIAINCDLISWIEARPDTTVRMVTGESILVLESVDEVVRRIAAYRSSVLHDAGLGALVAGRAGQGPPPNPADSKPLETVVLGDDSMVILEFHP